MVKTKEEYLWDLIYKAVHSKLTDKEAQDLEEIQKESSGFKKGRVHHNLVNPEDVREYNYD